MKPAPAPTLTLRCAVCGSTDYFACEPGHDEAGAGPYLLTNVQMLNPPADQPLRVWCVAHAPRRGCQGSQRKPSSIRRKSSGSRSHGTS